MVRNALSFGGLDGREEVGGGLGESIASDGAGEGGVGAERGSERSGLGDAFVGGGGGVEGGSRGRFLSEEGLFPICERYLNELRIGGWKRD